MTYKYYFILILIIVVLYFVYQSNDSTVQMTEDFNPRFKPSTENIRLIAESSASKLVASTFAKIIVPCTKPGFVTNHDIIQCISSYDRFYEDILRDNIADMYDYIKQVEDTYAGYTYQTHTKERQILIVVVANAYEVALESAMNYIEHNYDTAGFDQNNFIPIFTNYLIETLKRGISSLYTNYPLTNTQNIQDYAPNENEKQQINEDFDPTHDWNYQDQSTGDEQEVEHFAANDNDVLMHDDQDQDQQWASADSGEASHPLGGIGSTEHFTTNDSTGPMHDERGEQWSSMTEHYASNARNTLQQFNELNELFV